MTTQKRVLAVIMGGWGAARRLAPLTTERCKPAVPLAGKYRLVDIPISNCINSDINRIFLLTQFNTASLHRHVQGALPVRPLRRGLRRHPFRRADREEPRLVPGNGRRPSAGTSSTFASTPTTSSHPLGRPALPDGLQADHRPARGDGRGGDHRGAPGPGLQGRGPRRHAGRRRPVHPGVRGRSRRTRGDRGGWRSAPPWRSS